jgi:hypothetical protein
MSSSNKRGVTTTKVLHRAAVTLSYVCTDFCLCIIKSFFASVVKVSYVLYSGLVS